jgi:hypothetical protein
MPGVSAWLFPYRENRAPIRVGGKHSDPKKATMKFLSLAVSFGFVDDKDLEKFLEARKNNKRR